jgi:hypothetical protein
MKRKRVKRLQRALNAYTKKAKLGYSPLKVDGEFGPATKRRVRHVKFDLGYVRKRIRAKSGPELLWRLEHPNRTGGPFNVTARAVARGRKRRIKRRARVAANRARALFTPGVGTFDGKPVARPLIPYLQWARANGWRGVLVSGFRTPAYSESLCIRMCGRPSCPGRCAGRTSRHSQITLLLAAADVSDYVRFGQLMARCPHQPHLRNTLGARDPVHFSVAGN